MAPKDVSRYPSALRIGNRLLVVPAAPTAAPWRDCSDLRRVVLVVASGSTSGVVKTTPSGVGLGVAVIAVCGDPATPLSSWMRINKAKSSCTVLWQWLT
jgi:hypothetical protein